MSDVYVEDPIDEEAHLSTVRRLRLELARAATRLERAVHDSASNVADETRLLARRTQRRINSRLGLAAAVALGTGLALGLLAAVLSADRSGRRRGNR